MTVQEKLIKNKLGLLELASYLGNVSEACRVAGLSRDTFYRVKNAYETGGMEALIERSRKRPNLRNRVDAPRAGLRPRHVRRFGIQHCALRHIPIVDPRERHVGAFAALLTGGCVLPVPLPYAEPPSVTSANSVSFATILQLLSDLEFASLTARFNLHPLMSQLAAVLRLLQRMNADQRITDHPEELRAAHHSR